MRGRNRLGTTLRGNAADIGSDPPLLIGEDAGEAPARRSVSIRWLCGTILAGFASIFLMGGALMAALNNPTQLASLPDSLAGGGDPSGGIAFGRKGDRMRPTEEEVSSRQLLQVSTVTKQGERDFIKLRPFAWIVATLSSPSPEYADEIPPFDALRVFADTSAPEPEPEAAAKDGAAPDGAQPEGELADQIGVAERAILQTHPALPSLSGAGAQHQPRKVDLPPVRRRVRAVIEAELALITEIDDFLDVRRGQLVDVAVDSLHVHAIEQHLERRTQR